MGPVHVLPSAGIPVKHGAPLLSPRLLLPLGNARQALNAGGSSADLSFSVLTGSKNRDMMPLLPNIVR